MQPHGGLSELGSRAAGWRRQERHLTAGCGGRNGADERQVPDDIADAAFHLDDRARGHVACRATIADAWF